MERILTYGINGGSELYQIKFEDNGNGWTSTTEEDSFEVKCGDSVILHVCGATLSRFNVS